jgi:acyl-CoA synthetase (AMP-forming)/AMP-acid ligase II
VTGRAVAQSSGTIATAFAACASQYAAREFLSLLPEPASAYGIEPRSWSYRDAAAEVQRLQRAYKAAAFGPDQRVGLLLRNRPEFIFHWFALNALGVSVVPLSAEWRASELEFVIAHSELRSAVCIAERSRDVAAAALAIGRKVDVIAPDGIDIRSTGETAAADARPGSDTECALLYTSGTTGKPKGCVLPNEYFLHAGSWYAGVGGLCDVRPAVERMLTPLPMTHMNAMAFSTMCMMLTGGCLILLDRFHPRSWWQRVREARATIVHYLGVMPAMLLATPETPDDQRHDVRFGFGAGVSPRHHQAFEQRFGFPLIEGWAMTETGAGAVIIANREPRSVGTACFGVPDAQVECRVVDDSGIDVAADVTGELLVRHAGSRPRSGFFSGYLKEGDATTEAWRDGWFHTGDLVARDRSGRFRFVDRRKNLIRRSGENISAVEVEAVLAQHASVKTAAVASVPDEIRGDEVFACIVPRDPDAAGPSLARALADYCRERLAYYKVPGYVAFCASVPLTSTEKIQRTELRDLARQLLNERSCVDLRPLKRPQA